MKNDMLSTDPSLLAEENHYTKWRLVGQVSCDVLQQLAKGEHPGLAHGSNFSSLPLSIWDFPQTILASNVCFNYRQNTSRISIYRQSWQRMY